MGTIIKAENLTKVYLGKIKAVDQISLDIEEGEVYGLLGPNGAGKTTLISMLTTRLTPTSGTAVIKGYDIKKNSMDVRKIIGVVPQDLTTDEDLTGMENLLMVSQFYDVPKPTANERIKNLLRLVNLEEAAGRYVRQYSGGMRKRLELITGLVHDPDILFLDEPTLGLDVQTRTQMWEYVRDVQEKLNVTIILTSHYLEEVDALADRISIIDHGKILITGKPSELKASLQGDIIQLTTKEPEELEILKSFPEAIDVKDFGPNSVRLRVKDSDDQLPSLIKFISEKGVNVVRMTVQKPSLDEVFLQYTGRDIRAEDAGDVRKMMMNMRRMRR